jgi:hypothetical protein
MRLPDDMQEMENEAGSDKDEEEDEAEAGDSLAGKAAAALAGGTAGKVPQDDVDQESDDEGEQQNANEDVEDEEAEQEEAEEEAEAAAEEEDDDEVQEEEEEAEAEEVEEDEEAGEGEAANPAKLSAKDRRAALLQEELQTRLAAAEHDHARQHQLAQEQRKQALAQAPAARLGRGQRTANTLAKAAEEEANAPCPPLPPAARKAAEAAARKSVADKLRAELEAKRREQARRREDKDIERYTRALLKEERLQSRAAKKAARASKKVGKKASKSDSLCTPAHARALTLAGYNSVTLTKHLRDLLDGVVGFLATTGARSTESEEIDAILDAGFFTTLHAAWLCANPVPHDLLAEGLHALAGHLRRQQPKLWTTRSTTDGILRQIQRILTACDSSEDMLCS